MKPFLVLLAFGCLAIGVYKIHSDRVKDAAETAAIAARGQAKAEADAAEKARRSKILPQAVALSRTIEPLYVDLFSELNYAQPADLVPPIEITRERIIDKQTHVEAEKQPIYELGVRLLAAMAVVGEERTKALQAMLQAAQAKGSLEGPNSMTRSGAFFAQGAMKRWDDERKRRRPPLDQLFAQLRNAEREWNKRVGERAKVDTYDLPALSTVFVTTEPATTSNPLDRDPYNQRRVLYPWRTTYYDQYGSRSTYR